MKTGFKKREEVGEKECQSEGWSEEGMTGMKVGMQREV